MDLVSSLLQSKTDYIIYIYIYISLSLSSLFDPLQEDRDFVHLLNELRLGNVSQQTISTLNERSTTKQTKPASLNKHNNDNNNNDNNNNDNNSNTTRVPSIFLSSILLFLLLLLLPSSHYTLPQIFESQTNKLFIQNQTRTRYIRKRGKWIDTYLSLYPI